MTLPAFRQGSYSDMNSGRACWSCAGLMGHTAGERCIYPHAHGGERNTDVLHPAKRCPHVGPPHVAHDWDEWWCSGKGYVSMASVVNRQDCPICGGVGEFYINGQIETCLTCDPTGLRTVPLPAIDRLALAEKSEAALRAEVERLRAHVVLAWEQGYKTGYSYRGPFGAGQPVPENPYGVAL